MHNILVKPNPCIEPLWFAVQTKPRQEQRACENLVRQGFETYLPKIKIRKRRRGQWQKVTEALFPNYLFICADPSVTSLASVRSTIGVSKLVRFGQLIKPVPNQMIHLIKSREDTGTGQLIHQPKPLKKGDRVEILDGPFTGLAALFETEKAEDRVLLFLNLLGGQTAVTLHKDHVTAFL